MIELPGGDWALPYTGFNVPHKYPRVKAERHTGYALWPKERFAGVQARESGSLTTVYVIPPGQKVLINTTTPRAGSIRAEVLDGKGEVIPGREMERSIPLFGDLFWEPLRWESHQDTGARPDDAVAIRLKLNQATVYGLEFTEA